MNTTLYDQIGTGYVASRRADPRIAEQILEAIAVATTVVNVGAGSGSYEPVDKRVVAVEPSATMIRQRPRGGPPAVQATAEMLPFEADSFDCGLAVLTVHHWADPLAGLRELRRVARKRVVVLTWDQNLWERFWLVAEYLPALALFDRLRAIPLELIISVLGSCEVRPVTVPYDCLDGFLGAYWRRPSAYLDANIRAVISGFAQVPASDYDEGIRRLAVDLETGTWQKNHRDLLEVTTVDLGYRLIVADKRPRE